MGEASETLENRAAMRLVGDKALGGRRDQQGEESEKRPKVRRRRGRKAKVNKTEAIRSMASKLAANGSRPRPIEVVEALKKKGIHVVGSQVSMALKGTGMEFRPAPRRGPAELEGFPDLDTAVGQVGLDDLLAAREFVQRIGSLEKAMAALVAFKQFGGEQSAATEQTKSQTAAADGHSPEKARAAMRLTY